MIGNGSQSSDAKNPAPSQPKQQSNSSEQTSKVRLVDWLNNSGQSKVPVDTVIEKYLEFERPRIRDQILLALANEKDVKIQFSLRNQVAVPTTVNESNVSTTVAPSSLPAPSLPTTPPVVNAAPKTASSSGDQSALPVKSKQPMKESQVRMKAKPPLLASKGETNNKPGQPDPALPSKEKLDPVLVERLVQIVESQKEKGIFFGQLANLYRRRFGEKKRLSHISHLKQRLMKEKDLLLVWRSNTGHYASTIWLGHVSHVQRTSTDDHKPIRSKGIRRPRFMILQILYRHQGQTGMNSEELERRLYLLLGYRVPWNVVKEEIPLLIAEGKVTQREVNGQTVYRTVLAVEGKPATEATEATEATGSRSISSSKKENISSVAKDSSQPLPKPVAKAATDSELKVVERFLQLIEPHKEKGILLEKENVPSEYYKRLGETLPISLTRLLDLLLARKVIVVARRQRPDLPYQLWFGQISRLERISSSSEEPENRKIKRPFFLLSYLVSRRKGKGIELSELETRFYKKLGYRLPWDVLKEEISNAVTKGYITQKEVDGKLWLWNIPKSEAKSENAVTEKKENNTVHSAS